MSDNNGRIGLMGFDRLKLFPIVKNEAAAYEVGTGVAVPHVQNMTKEADVSEQKVYADDTLYLNVINFNGLNVEITVAEMDLANWAQLGFGEYDEATKTLKWNPQGTNKEFGMTFRCLMANGKYRMYRFYRFAVSTVTEGEMATKGEDAGVRPYTITGTLSQRALDNSMSEIHDGDDYSWLDTIPSANGSDQDGEETP